ncbi:integrase/recombinase XerD [Halorubrum ezzemoulense]|uniref:Integrase/recombinase XerD n=1 Tax=Halorubrum ezzemoulense TaxID=337243 RepID=A0A238XHT2_HALEZ|nr:tyrosine-type recombinase/integrase [Halorubrum ezzemoulense]SNR58138.1 integrase/recombinase XerD [Halorubrum ezzemoulense]
MDFDEILEQFKNRRSRISSETTANIYLREIRNWRQWLTEERDKGLWNAETVDLRVRMESMTDAGKAPSTITKQVSAVSKFYQDCEKMAKKYDMPDVQENPYAGLDSEDKQLLRGDTKKKEAMKESGGDEYPYLEPDKISQLVDNVPSPRLRNELIIKLLYNCGFRRGELAKTKIDHIDREDRSIFIPPRKSPESRTVAYKEDYLGFQLDQWLDYGGRDSMTYAEESEYLFPTNNGEHISGNAMNRMVRKAAENAGFQEVIDEYVDGRKVHKVTAHTLRHSFAMRAINSGIDIKTLQTLLGHEELDTTLIYLDQAKDEAKENSRAFQPLG